MNPYVLIATHKRVEITKKNIECLLKCDVGVILIVSDREEFDLFKQLFPVISVIHHANYPLGLKWQSGVDVARHLKADPLIINGSDDILSPKYFQRVADLLEEGHHFIGLKSWYVYDLKTVYRFDYLASIPLGGGRAYSRALLEKIGYKLFDVRKERHLDDYGWSGVISSKLSKVLLNEPLILSVKGDWPVMNPVNKMFASRNAMLRESIHNPVNILEQFNLCVESQG